MIRAGAALVQSTIVRGGAQCELILVVATAQLRLLGCSTSIRLLCRSRLVGRRSRDRFELRLALAGLAKHKLSELLTLDLSIDLIRELANVLRKHGLLRKLLAVVLLDVAQLSFIRHFCVVDDWLYIVF